MKRIALALVVIILLMPVTARADDYSNHMISLKRFLWRGDVESTVRATHDYLVLTIEYAYKDEGTAYQAIVERETNCKGYSEAMREILAMWNIKCEVVYGIYNGTLHAWNRVRFSDDWYYIDVTLDDTGDGLISAIHYKSAELFETHREFYIEKIEVKFIPLSFVRIMRTVD